MNKLLGISLITSQLLYAGGFSLHGINVMDRNPLNTSYQAKSNGGTKDDIDAYQDGVGVYIVQSFEKDSNSSSVDNSALNTLVYKFGDAAKSNGVSLKDQVMNDPSSTASDKALAAYLNGATTPPVSNAITCLGGTVGETTADGHLIVDRNSLVTLISNHEDVSNVCTSNITDMTFLISNSGNYAFNQDISKWDVSHVTNMGGMFDYATLFNQDISNWNVSNVINMSCMFMDATSFNQPLNSWDVSNVLDMYNMFGNATSFNQDINNWNVSSVTDMSWMFVYASSFNQPLNSWVVSHVTDMSYMFYGASSFNQDINNWNVSSVINMSDMFYEASLFNQPLNSWDVSHVTDMRSMFYGATLFNQNIHSWTPNIGGKPFNFDYNSGFTEQTALQPIWK